MYENEQIFGTLKKVYDSNIANNTKTYSCNYRQIEELNKMMNGLMGMNYRKNEGMYGHNYRKTDVDSKGMNYREHIKNPKYMHKY